MKQRMYRTWIVTGILLFAAGILVFAKDRADSIAFMAGAGIVTINVLLLGKGISAALGYSKNKAVYIFLFILKYAFLLTTLYITIVIIKLNPLPFILGVTILPLSIMVMAIFLMLRRQDNA